MTLPVAASTVPSCSSRMAAPSSGVMEREAAISSCGTSVSGAERPQAVSNSRADRAAQSTHEIFMGTLPFASACRAE